MRAASQPSSLVGVGHEQDVARVEGEARLELVAVLLDVAVDLLLGDRDPQGHLAPDELLHHDLVAQPLLDDSAVMPCARTTFSNSSSFLPLALHDVVELLV